jgi:hypothetical protein
MPTEPAAEIFPDIDLTKVPGGTLAVVLSDGTRIVLLYCFDFEVSGDGDLIARHSRRGKSVSFEPGEWSAIGTVEHMTEGGSYIAFERFAETG